jgi:ELWxxDGT repeat protein
LHDVNTTEGEGSDPFGYTRIGALLYFAAAPSGGWPRELWRTDGANANRLGVGLAVPDEVSAIVLPAAGDDARSLVFAALDERDELGAWCTDGSESGTRQALTSEGLPAGATFSFPRSSVLYLARTDRHAYLLAHPGAVPGADLSIHCSEAVLSALWRIDCDAQQATLLIEAPPTSDCQWPSPLKATRDVVYFLDGNRTLWQSDGTLGGTSSRPTRAAARAFAFDALWTTRSHVLWVERTDDGAQLWASDGEGNATLLKAAADIRTVTLIDDLAFFAADDPEYGGSEPWLTDGTQVGTRRLADVNPGAQGSFPESFTRVQNTLFFVAVVHDQHGPSIWKASPEAWR